MAAPIYKQSMPVRTVLYVLLAAFLAVFPAQSRAEIQSNYTVEGVEVDVTAENAVKAREKAMDEAQVKAYQMLAERLLGEESAKTMPVPDPVTVSSMVQDFEVTKEQLSTKRYKGTYTVRFRPNAVRGKMTAAGLPDPARKPVLVLPFYQVGGQTVLWSDTNPWLNAWRSFSSTAGAVVPIGDAHDIAQVSDADGLQYSPMEVQQLAARYGADDVAVLLASPEPTNTQGRLAVNIYSNGFNGPALVQKIVVDQQAGEETPVFFQRAAGQVRQLLATNWKANAAYNPAAQAQAPTQQQTYGRTQVYQQQQPQYAQPSHTQQTAPYVQQQRAAPMPYTRTTLGAAKNYAARARFSSVQDWVRMKNTLDSVYGMQAVMIKSLKSREAVLDIRYAGDIPALQLALQNAGIMMRGAQDGSLEIYTGAGMTPVYR